MAPTHTKRRRRFLHFVDRALLGMVMTVVVMILERLVHRASYRKTRHGQGASAA